MRKEITNCPICESSDFMDLDYLRDFKYWYHRDFIEDVEKIGFKICRSCGFVTYNYEENQGGQYDNQRKQASYLSFVVGSQRNIYRFKFLDEILEKLPRDANIIDIGCASGEFLNGFKERGFTNLYGTEYATKLSKFANKIYGLNVSEKLDESIKYDFISYYRVLEHIPNPQIELLKIRNLISDNGYLYISVPVWGDILNDEMSGAAVESFENYYHLNHVNVFTEISIVNLLNKCGFEIIKRNDTYHGFTVLCRKSDKRDIVKENYEEIVKRFQNQKDAIELYNQQKFDDSIKVYDKYIDSWLTGSTTKEYMKDFGAQINRLNKAIEVCGRQHKIINQIAKVYFQWDENTPGKQYYSNNIKMAEKLFLECIELRPGVEDSYYFLGIIEGKYKKNIDKSIEYFRKLIEVNPTKYAEAWNMIGFFVGNIC